jgi:p-methyltransferase
MTRSIDLILLTDEPIDWEGDYWMRSSQKVEREQRNLNIRGRDKTLAEAAYGVADYFRPLPGTEDHYRIRVPHRPHLSLTDLATVAREQGYECRIVDNVLRYPGRMKQVEDLMRDRPKAVGISTTFLLTPDVVRHYVTKIRELDPEVKVILGGPTVRKSQELHGFADFAVFGDGEDPMLGILEALDGKRGIETVPHIAYRDAAGNTCYGPSGAESAHVGIDGKAFKARDVHIPVPDWRLANRSFDNVFAIEFSRGCKYNCFYCSYDRGKNIRDLDEIRRELVTNAELGITKYRVSDSNFTDGPPRYQRYPHDVCQAMIDLDLGLQWSCYARVDDLSDELADLMRRAGCFGVFFGIESGSKQILKNMRKGHDVDDAHNGVAIAKRNGLRCHGSFIIGYPGETIATYEETLHFIETARPDTVNLGQFRVEHDTPVYGVKEFELEGQGMKWRHKTMNNETADELVTRGNARLLKNGICLGTECSFPTFMGLGMTIQESLQMMQDMDLVGQESQRGLPHFEDAKTRLRQIILERFPKAIAKDQRMWEASLA